MVLQLIHTGWDCRTKWMTVTLNISVIVDKISKMCDCQHTPTCSRACYKDKGNPKNKPTSAFRLGFACKVEKCLFFSPYSPQSLAQSNRIIRWSPVMWIYMTVWSSCPTSYTDDLKPLKKVGEMLPGLWFFLLFCFKCKKKNKKKKNMLDCHITANPHLQKSNYLWNWFLRVRQWCCATRCKLN